MKTALTATVFATALAACGGGSGNNAPVAAPVSSAPVTASGSTATSKLIKSQAGTLQHVTIVMTGDSTQYGLECNTMGTDNDGFHQSTLNVPTLLQQYFDADFPGKVTIINRGYPGSTSLQILNGGGPVPVSFATALVQDHPNIIVFNPGINDFPGVTDLQTLRTDHLFNIGQMQQQAVAQGIIGVPETPNPAVGGEPRLTWFAIDTVNWASQYGIPYVDTYSAFAQLPNWGNDLCDGIHPTDSGYNYIAMYAAYPVLKPLVAQLLAQ